MNNETAYTREQLVSICERAVVNVEKWNDRDTPNSQVKVGFCWALLKAGCQFDVIVKPSNPNDSCVTNDTTIWLYVYWPSFYDIESGDWNNERQCSNNELFYLPTKARLEKVNGEDWY